MKIAVARERAEGELRVAATPETVAKLMALGATVTIESGAGEGSRLPDSLFAAAGATVVPDAASALDGADILLTVRRPDAGALSGLAPGALVIGALDPYGNQSAVEGLARAGVSAIAMEFMPRITRAQVMDILSSQANLAGYQAVIDAAAEFGRALPMMMTAAGTVRPAKAFVMGAGVAGLQAIATARRLGAVVSATDVRPAAKEQVESLGGKFIAVEDEEFKQAETAGGYAKQMSAEYQSKQAALTAEHIAKQDIVITTALIPGRPAPRLIDRAMVQSMAPGSVIVDLAAERGGNVELTVPDQVVEHNGVKIIGYRNWGSRIAATASQLYARNLLAFVETLFDKKTKAFAVNWDDELLKATVLTRDGRVVHPSFENAASETVPGAASPSVSSAMPAASAPIASAAPAAPERAPEAVIAPAPVFETAEEGAVAAPKPRKTGARSKTGTKSKAEPKGKAEPKVKRTPGEDTPLANPAMAQTPRTPQPGVEPVQPQEPQPAPTPRRRTAATEADAGQGASGELPGAQSDELSQAPDTNKPAGPEGSA